MEVRRAEGVLSWNMTSGDGVMTVAVILVVSWQSGTGPSGHHEVGPGYSANRK